MLYDAARKAMTAPLARQGLRPTNKNGHCAVQEGIEAQLGPNARTEEVTLALGDSRDIVSAMTKFVPNVGPWH